MDFNTLIRQLTEYLLYFDYKTINQDSESPFIQICQIQSASKVCSSCSFYLVEPGESLNQILHTTQKLAIANSLTSKYLLQHTVGINNFWDQQGFSRGFSTRSSIYICAVVTSSDSASWISRFILKQIKIITYLES